MYVSEKRKLIFLAHPRTASRAVVAALQSVELEHLGFEPHPKTSHHDTLTEHPGLGWTVFTVVRNHFDAWVSWQAFNGARRPCGPRRSIQDTVRGTMQLTSHFPDPRRMWALHCGYADVLMRYETLEADLRAAFHDTLTLPHIGGSERHADYRDAYDAEARAFIELRFGAEMEELGYRW